MIGEDSDIIETFNAYL